jgi:signal transduction histidine kinase
VIMNLNRPTVLILSSDPAFSRAVTEAWPGDAETPEFTLLEEDLRREFCRDTYDLAVADASSRQKRDILTEALLAAGKPAIVVYSNPASDQSSTRGPILWLRRDPESWPCTLGLVGREILRRCQAESRTRESERIRAAAEAEATLGRYMAEMRHSTSNALTSILGNAELLLLEPGLPATVLAQADTIRNMALRLHEVFQRFSSIEKELSVAARESVKETAQSRAATA